MKYPIFAGAAAVTAAMVVSGAFAQSRPAATDGGAVAPPVVSDVGPAPAQERNSIGAVVLENSMVRAQRENAFEKASSRTGVASVGRGVLRATMKARAEADLAQAREAEAVEFHERGAATLQGK